MSVKICIYSNYFPTSRNFYNRTVFIIYIFSNCRNITEERCPRPTMKNVSLFCANYYNIFCSFGKHNVKSRKEGRKNGKCSIVIVRASFTGFSRRKSFGV